MGGKFCDPVRERRPEPEPEPAAVVTGKKWLVVAANLFFLWRRRQQ